MGLSTQGSELFLQRIPEMLAKPPWNFTTSLTNGEMVNEESKLKQIVVIIKLIYMNLSSKLNETIISQKSLKNKAVLTYFCFLNLKDYLVGCNCCGIS